MRTLILGIVLLLTSCAEGQTTFKNISKQDLSKVLKEKEVQLIDVRTKAEFEEGYIKRAVHIDYWSEAFLSKVTQKFDKQKPIYLYCKVGGRSSKAAKLLIKNGFTKVFSLEGGYTSWTKN